VLTTADNIGYPVTLKALHIAHKTDVGAVAVGVADASALRRCLESMPPTATEFLVEQTITGVVAEILVAIRRAAPIGWLITLGTGGILTELWRDTTCLLAPVSRDDIRGALSTLRTAPLLHGYRGKPAGDLTAVIDLVMALQHAVVGSNVAEVEINPVLVTSSAAVAVDALVIDETQGTT
jgi:hypothetical protein